MMSFIIADLSVIPEAVKQVYLVSRLGMQLPILCIFFALTFLPNYHRIYHLVLCISLLLVCYANYWLIVQCWQIAEFSFSYEGTLLYGLFCMFIMRLSFKFSIIFVSFTIFGFALIVGSYPVYAGFGMVNLGFVSLGLLISLIGVKQIESAFGRFQHLNEKLVHLNQIDQLTGLYNRGALEQQFDLMLSVSNRIGTSISVFMIDLDNFKDFNDGYGHLRGDEVIRIQAEILRQVFNRETDTVARYGGEEFIVISLGINALASEALAAEVLREWARRKIQHGKGQGQDFVSCSIGLISTHVDKDTQKTQLIDRADKALYVAKNEGRARFINADIADGSS
ncbi:diguanylate cyclase [Paraglaciecola sp. T6c]|uniref:GGDEF domain-containing protein n=1 Tax=Pseudoalteromonas atlantica (strain T6c / ATCC BAA-1087) TaxID=3042615 RepID=UPI00005C592B|nr:GGDEF domain-containing protein [Paraglaciecola sp. T6c]ABG39947.1 diguanylate cyclase [Paraglaciecola sp. T6c]